MPISTQFTADGRGAIQTGVGVVTAQEILAEMIHQHTDPERPKGHDYVLIDFTRVTEIRARAADVPRLVLEQEIVALQAPRVAIAIAAESDAVFGMARMWEGHATALHWERAVFRSRREAVAWLDACRGPVEAI